MEAVGKFFLIHFVSGESDHVLVKNSTADIHLSRMFTFSYTAAIVFPESVGPALEFSLTQNIGIGARLRIAHCKVYATSRTTSSFLAIRKSTQFSKAA